MCDLLYSMDKCSRESFVFCIHSIVMVSFFVMFSPCFNEGERLNGLQRGDAQFVDIIHTNVGILGIKEPRGDVDFYPNGSVKFIEHFISINRFLSIRKLLK